MMQEKFIVSDALNSINSSLKTYTDMIAQTENKELRGALTQMRNEAETSQYELYQLARTKNYYAPSGQANQNEINSLKSIFAGSTGWSGNTGNTTTSGNTTTTGNTVTGNTGMSGGTSGVGGTGNYNAGVSGSQGDYDVTGSTGKNTAYGNKGTTNTTDVYSNTTGTGSTKGSKKSTTK